MTKVPAHITGTVWKVEKQVGDTVEVGEIIVIIESMKMEMPVEAPVAGLIHEIHCQEGQAISEGDVLALISER